MIQFTNRQHDIICAILNEGSPIIGKELAARLGVSLRTVQAEIARINRISPIIQGGNHGYVIPRQAASQLAQRVDAADAAGDCAPLPHRILQLLSCTNRRWRIDDVSEELFVSTPTAERSVRQIPAMLAPYHLELKRESGYLDIVGSERDKRRLIGGLVTQEAGAAFTTSRRAARFFDDMDIELVRSMTVSIIESSGCGIKQGYEDNLFASITIALYRMRMNAYLEEGALAPREPMGVEERIANELCKRYSAHFRITPRDADRAYLANLLRGQIEVTGRDDGAAHDEPALNALVRDVEALVNEALDAFLLHVDASQSLYNFAMHIDALLHRSRDSQMRDNGVLDNVKRRFPFVYEVSLLVANKISERYRIVLSDGEVGFICILMGLLLEHTAAPDCIRVGLRCTDYHGTAERIRAGIVRQYPQAVIFDLDGEDADAAVDLVVTTRRADASCIPHVEVSPFFTEDDRAEVTQALAACERRRRGLFMRRLFSTYLDERLFFVNDELEGKRDAIAFLGRQLYRERIVHEGFTASVLQREALSSTCFFDLFAVPHALEMNAARTMVAVLVSPKGIPWDDHTIHIVLMIAVHADDREAFMQLYDGIVKALWHSETAGRAGRATSAEEFIECIVNA